MAPEDAELEDAELKDTGDEAEGAEKEEREPLKLNVQIDSPGACQRHVTVTVPRDDIERYFDKAFADMMPTATVPGFRAGRAPRKLVEHRFRKDVADQVKGSLLMDSLSQVTEEQNLAAISEPDLDPAAIELPDEGPMSFEFDIEVRPEFDLPHWKGLTIERPVRQISAKDIDQELGRLLASRGRLVPVNGPASPGDYITANIAVKDGDETITEIPEKTVKLASMLSFRDGKIENFAKGLKGVEAGQSRTLPIQFSDEAPNERVRGRQISAVVDVLEVKKLALPEMTPELLAEFDCNAEGDLRDAVEATLKRQLVYHQQQRVRRQVTSLLVAAANWDLPPEMLKRQSRRELERAKLELQRSGFSDEQILAHENRLRQSTAENTARALKEHFILERIAEEEKIEESPQDYDDEIKLIARQSGESPRRVRAQLERQDLMDVLRNQIIENKTIELILSHANFKDVPFEPDRTDTESVDQTAGGGEEEESEIPEAKHGGDAEPLRGMDQRA
ncbi:MAG TPA: trigger factor [Pirellulales bacterium]|jgi:trigger factor|nr:trigger factor [Pirellulales bacterium]